VSEHPSRFDGSTLLAREILDHLQTTDGATVSALAHILGCRVRERGPGFGAADRLRAGHLLRLVLERGMRYVEGVGPTGYPGEDDPLAVVSVYDYGDGRLSILLAPDDGMTAITRAILDGD